MAQNSGEQGKKPGLFIAPRADLSWYSRNEPTMGGGLCFGYDGSKAASLGINAVYIIPIGSKDEQKLNALEITVFVREYVRRLQDNLLIATGPFFQLNAGVILFGFEDEMFKSNSVITGCFGLTLGWRVPLGKVFYLEPALRAGYPYGAAGEIAVGVRF